MASEVTKRNASIIIVTLFFGIFGVLATMVGVVDLMNPIIPWGHRLPMLGEIALAVGWISRPCFIWDSFCSQCVCWRTSDTPCDSRCCSGISVVRSPSFRMEESFLIMHAMVDLLKKR